MKRGAIYTAATGHGYGSKPRPVLIIQSDDFSGLTKVLVALIGSPTEDATYIRVLLEPDETNGLLAPSEVMVDTILAVRAEKFGRHVGFLREVDMARVDQALLTILGFARSS